MAKEFTGLRGALVYSNPGHRFDALPLHVAQTVLGRALGIGHAGYAEDFFSGDTDQWTVNEASEGTAASSASWGGLNQNDILGQRHGVGYLVTAAGTRARVSLQLRNQSFRYESGKKMWCFTRFKVADADASSFSFGLSVVTDNFLGGSLRGSQSNAIVSPGQHDDMIAFTKQATQTRWDFAMRKNGVETRRTQMPVMVLADNDYRELGFMVDETGRIHVYIDSTEFDTALVAAGTATIPDDTDLLLSIGLGNTSTAATAQRASFDWIVCFQESSL